MIANEDAVKKSHFHASFVIGGLGLKGYWKFIVKDTAKKTFIYVISVRNAIHLKAAWISI